MNGYSFETFDVHSANRAAFEACRAAARRAYSGARPLILLGGAGTGKSHLLWSVVRELRALKQRIGLGLVLPSDFPDSVRNLVVNPEPVRRGRPAILLVDELERFQDNAPDLEAVVKVFLDNGHDIVFATRTRPEELDSLSPGFRAVLARGNTVHIEAQSAPPFAEPETAGDEIARMLSELDALRIEREELLQTASERESEWETEKAALGAQCGGALERYRAATAERDAIQAENEALDARLQAVLADTARLNERLAQVETEAETVRGELAAAREERDNRAAQTATERERADELERRNAALDEQLAGTRSALDAARGELAAAREERDNRAAQIATERERADELERRNAALDEQLAGARSALDTARAESASLSDKLDALSAEREADAARMTALQERLDAAGLQCANMETLTQALAESEAKRAQTQAALAALETAAAARNELLDTLQRSLEERAGKTRGIAQALAEEAVRLAARLGAMETASTIFGKEELAAELAAVRARADAVYVRWEQDRRRFDREIESAQGERRHLAELSEALSAEKGRMQVMLDGALGRLEAAEFELERARKTLALRDAEMEALRQEAATQVASANIQAGEMEHRLLSLEASVARFLHRGPAEGDEEAARVTEELARAAEAFRALAARQAAMAEGDGETVPEEDPGQGWLFEKGASISGRLPNPLPGGGETLRQMVERALAEPEDA